MRRAWMVIVPACALAAGLLSFAVIAFAQEQRGAAKKAEEGPRAAQLPLGQVVLPPLTRAPSRSRLSREMVSKGMPLGQTAVHSPMLVQPPNPSASC